uniref:Uncharacterized protein n=1 Tax=Cereibacter sphaeroides (strain ATCC 17025 / ATH 2.4.3) TaxID=349102 RepID=A4WQN0_CERS5
MGCASAVGGRIAGSRARPNRRNRESRWASGFGWSRGISRRASSGSGPWNIASPAVGHTCAGRTEASRRRQDDPHHRSIGQQEHRKGERARPRCRQDAHLRLADHRGTGGASGH